METRSQHTRVEAHLILYSLPLSRRVFGLRGRGHKESNHFGQTTGSTDHRRHTCTQARMPLNIFSTRAQVAVGSGRLEVRVDTSLVLHRSFAYPVRTPSRPEDLDWEVTQDSNGCVCVNFHPHSLHPHSLSVCLLWCVCVKLSRCFHVALRQAVTFPPPFTSSVYLECLRMQVKDSRVKCQGCMGHGIKPASKGPRITRPGWTGGEWCG